MQAVDSAVVQKRLADRRRLCHTMKAAWIMHRGVHKSQGYVCLERLFGRLCKQYGRGHRSYCCPGCMSAVKYPVWDHADMWIKKDGALLLTLHPYATRMQVVKTFRALRDKYPVRLTIHGKRKSWWNPGGTLLVEVER